MIDEIKLAKNLIKINSTNPGKFEKDIFDFVEALLNKKKIKYKKYFLNNTILIHWCRVYYVFTKFKNRLVFIAFRN